MTIFEPIFQLQAINLNQLYQQGLLAQEYPELADLKHCPQNTKWHAEGDVLIHTQMVLEQGLSLLDYLDSYDEKLALLLGCILHDIGKPLVTNHETLSAAGHEGAGIAPAGKILNTLKISPYVKTLVLSMVKDHGVPRALVQSQAKSKSYRKLALRANCKMLYYLELADFQGREGETKEESLLQLEQFKENCQKLHIFSGEIPLEIQNFQQMIQSLSLSPLKTQWIVRQHVKYWLEGKLPQQLNEPSIQKLLNLKEPPWLCYTVGISGSGKSTWSSQQQQFFYISTDKTREELNGDESDRSQDFLVFEECYKRLRNALKQKKSVLWDATNITYKARERLLNQANPHFPFVGAIYFPLKIKDSLEQNQQRQRNVPEYVVYRQANIFSELKFHEYDFCLKINKENRNEPLSLPTY